MDVIPGQRICICITHHHHRHHQSLHKTTTDALKSTRVSLCQQHGDDVTAELLHLLTARDVTATVLPHFVYQSVMLVYFKVPGGGGAFYLANHLAACAQANPKNKNKKSPAWGVFVPLTPQYGAGFPKALHGSRVSERQRWCQARDVYSERKTETTAIKTTESFASVQPT